MVEVCYQLVIKWIKKMAIQIDEVTRDFQANKNKIPLLGMDELYTYIKKKQIKSGTAVDRNRLRLASRL